LLGGLYAVTGTLRKGVPKMTLPSDCLESLKKISKAAIVPDNSVMQKELKILAKAVLELNKQLSQMEEKILTITRRLGSS
jgi:hypothetical protein